MSDEVNETTTDKPNVFRMIQGDKVAAPTEGTALEPSVPQHEYVIVDIDGIEYDAEGFLLFTSQHIAVMRDTGDGALPVLVIPLNRVRSAELVDTDGVFED